HSVGEEIKAEMELGVVLYPKGYVPKHVMWSKDFLRASTDLDIPAGTIDRVDGYTYFQKAARITSYQPHMHIRGKRQCLEFIYPTPGPVAQTEIVSCANFNYNWHLIYT